MHQLGGGVLGPVYRTYDPKGGRLVAVKAFTVGLTPEQADLFVDALKQIVDVGLEHPAIVAPILAGLEDGIPFIAQEYVTAESLDVAMRHFSPAPPRRVLTYVRQLAAAVDFAHARGVMHGAMHLRDVFVTPDEMRVTGFGVASALEHVGLRVPIRRSYSAPEMIAGRRWGPEADRFAVAAIGYELLTGKRVSGTGDEVLARLMEVETTDVADPVGLQHAFRNALADEPDLRPASAVGFVAALGDAVGGSANKPTPALAASDTNVAADAVNVGDPLSERVPDQPSAEEPAGNASIDPLANQDLEHLTGFAEAGLKTFDRALDGLAPLLDESSAVAPLPGNDGGDAEPNDDEVADGLEKKAYVTAPINERLPLEPEDPEEVYEGRLVEPEEVDNHQEEIGLTGPSEMTVADSRASYKVGAEDDKDGAGLYASLMAAEVTENFVDTLNEAETDEGKPARRAADIESTGEADSDVAAESLPFVSTRSGPLRAKEIPVPRVSMRAMVPVVLAMVTGVLVAYIVSVGLSTTGDDDAPVLIDVAADAVEPASPLPNAGEAAERAWSEQAVDAAPENTADRAVLETAPVDVATAVLQVAGESPEAQVSTPVLAEPGVGWLLVRTEPPGATVRVDGNDRGVAPLSLADMPHGTYLLEVSAPGYTSQGREVEISADTSIAAVNVMLVRAPEVTAEAVATTVAEGSVYVDSRPPGAAVFVDGERVGLTPLLVPDVTAGSHRVRIEGNGYRPWTMTVTVLASQRAHVAASLEPGTRR